ncbi:MAG: inositol monophosphatase family protein, partial [Pseudomonadota bacterium]
GLSEATLMTTSPDLFEGGEVSAFAAVRDQSRLIRYGADCYAYAILALGQIDLVIEAGLKAYDIAAPMALVQAAGGVVSDWRGRDCRWGGRILAAGDPRVHEAALEILSRVPES